MLSEPVGGEVKNGNIPCRTTAVAQYWRKYETHEPVGCFCQRSDPSEVQLSSLLQWKYSIWFASRRFPAFVAGASSWPSPSPTPTTATSQAASTSPSWWTWGTRSGGGSARCGRSWMSRTPSGEPRPVFTLFTLPIYGRCRPTCVQHYVAVGRDAAEKEVGWSSANGKPPCG